MALKVRGNALGVADDAGHILGRRATALRNANVLALAGRRIYSDLVVGDWKAG